MNQNYYLHSSKFYNVVLYIIYTMDKGNEKTDKNNGKEVGNKSYKELERDGEVKKEAIEDEEVIEEEEDREENARAIMSRRKAIAGSGIIAGLFAAGGFGYGQFFSESKSVEMGDFEVSGAEIRTAAGNVESIELSVETFEIDYVNVTDEYDVDVELLLTENTDNLDQDEVVDSTEVTLPQDSEVHGTIEVDDLIDEFDITDVDNIDAEDFENPDDQTEVEYNFEFQAVVRMSDHDNFDEDITKETDATLTVENVGANADAMIEGDLDGEPVTPSKDLEDIRDDDD